MTKVQQFNYMFSIKKNKDSPQREKIRYLKTLNDELLSKTEMALLAINDYEMRRSRIFVPKTSFILEAERCPSDQRTVHLTLREDEDLKISMLGGTPEYYKIDCRDKIFPLKFEFKHLKHSLRFIASFKNMFPSEKNCDHSFTIDKAIRKNIQAPKNTKNVDTLFISIEAKNSIGMMTMHYNFYNQVLDNIKKGTSLRIRNYSQLSPVKSLTVHEQTPQKFLSPTPRLKTQSSKMLRTESTNFRTKNIFEASHYQKLTHSRRILSTDRRNSRINETQMRRDDYWQHRDKERELIHKASQNKQAIGLKQVKVSQQLYDRRILTRDITAFLYMQKLLNFIHVRRTELCEEIRMKARISMYQNKFIRSIKDSYRKTCHIMPHKQSRDKCTIHEVLYLLTRMDKQTAEKRATKVIINLFQNIMPSFRMNQSQGQATKFRRKLRFVQKVWRNKYSTRLNMVKICGQRHVHLLLDTYPKFQKVHKQFTDSNHLHSICVEYIKECTIKFNEIYMGYFKKKEELEDLKKMNEQLKNKNKTRSQKQQMALLYVPPEPIIPHYRYFRDLDILRSMIRNWFEIQLKKYVKKTLNKS